MASFTPNHQKKKEHLQDKEDELRRLIARAESREKLLEAATAVRDARIRVVRVKQAIGPQSLVERSTRLRIEREIADLKSISAEEVLAEFLHGKENVKQS